MPAASSARTSHRNAVLLQMQPTAFVVVDIELQKPRSQPVAAEVGFWGAWPLWREAMAVSLMAAALCSFVGVYVVLRRVVFVSAALSQLAGVGVATAFYLASITNVDPHRPPLALNPIWYASLFAVAGAVLFSLNLAHRRVAGETVVGLGYLLAAASVLVVLNSPKVTQEAHEVSDLLYGNAVAVSPAMVKVMAGTVAVLIPLHLVFRKEFVFVSFDAEMARSLGIAARIWTLLLFISIAAAASIATRAIGALPAFGFMVVPPAAALLVTDRLWSASLVAVAMAMAAAGFGYYVSFHWSLPTGASMVMVSALFLAPGLVRLARGGDS
jgi:zinc transport system permease protein